MQSHLIIVKVSYKYCRLEYIETRGLKCDFTQTADFNTCNGLLLLCPGHLWAWTSLTVQILGYNFVTMTSTICDDFNHVVFCRVSKTSAVPVSMWNFFLSVWHLTNSARRGNSSALSVPFSRPCPMTPTLLRLKNSSRGLFFSVSTSRNLECCCPGRETPPLLSKSRGNSFPSTRRKLSCWTNWDNFTMLFW